jgi:hypothetical protein
MSQIQKKRMGQKRVHKAVQRIAQNSRMKITAFPVKSP